jgi:hypothetical protein
MSTSREGSTGTGTHEYVCGPFTVTRAHFRAQIRKQTDMALTWTTRETEYGPDIDDGFSGKFRMFSAFWDGTLSKGPVGGQIKLTGRLPGYKEDLGHYETTEAAKAKAEQVFARWLTDAKLRMED